MITLSINDQLLPIVKISESALHFSDSIFEHHIPFASVVRSALQFCHPRLQHFLLFLQALQSFQKFEVAHGCRSSPRQHQTWLACCRRIAHLLSALMSPDLRPLVKSLQHDQAEASSCAAPHGSDCRPRAWPLVDEAFNSQSLHIHGDSISRAESPPRWSSFCSPLQAASATPPLPSQRTTCPGEKSHQSFVLGAAPHRTIRPA